MGSLVHAVSIALGTSEAQLHLAVKRQLLQRDLDVDILVDFWLQSQSLPMTHYLSVCSNVGSPIDRLFLWLASYAFSIHVNVIHGDGVWTTCRLVIPNFRDPAIIFVLGYYMATPACIPVNESSKKVSDSRSWLDYHDSLPKFVPYLCVLNGPVKDPENHCEEIGIQIDLIAQPIQVLLEDVVGKDYCEDLITWIKMHQYPHRSKMMALSHLRTRL